MHQTREIPREEWAKYLDGLSRREKDHPVHVEVEGLELGEQVLAERLPLVGLSLVQKGADAGAIEITLGEDGREMTHRITAPEHLYAEEGDGGQPEVLDIEDQAHAKTLVSFQCEGLAHPGMG